VHLEQFDRAGVIELIPLHDRKEEQLAWMPSVIS
jgi:hypothetical protein